MNRVPATLRRLRATVATGAVAVLAGCAAGSGTASPGPPAGTGSGPPSAEQRVGLTEWAVVTEGRPFPPGAVSLVVTNAGSAPHDLAVRVADEERAATAVLDPGEVAELAFPVAVGERVELWCTLTGHHAAGMSTVVDVVAPGTP